MSGFLGDIRLSKIFGEAADILIDYQIALPCLELLQPRMLEHVLLSFYNHLTLNYEMRKS